MIASIKCLHTYDFISTQGGTFMRKILSILLTVCMICGAMPLERAVAADLPEYEYTLENDEAELTAYNGAEKDIIIPDKIDGHNVTKLSGQIFQTMTSVESVDIPATVKSIEFKDNAIHDCSRLKTIKVAAENPNYSAYEGCLYSKDLKVMYVCPAAQTQVKFHQNVETIGEGAFCKCKDITSIVLPDSIHEVNSNAFRSCSKLTSISFSSKLRTISDMTFVDCGFKTIEIPGTIESIGRLAFHSCKALEKVVLSDGVRTLGESVFAGCSKLEAVEIPVSVTQIADSALDDCGTPKIYGYKTTHAQQYANRKNLMFISLDNSLLIDVRECEIRLEKDKVAYTGGAQEINVTVLNGDSTLTRGIDYNLTYKNNVNAGTATIDVYGIGKYTGDQKVFFTITKIDQQISVSTNAIELKAGQKTTIYAEAKGRISYTSTDEKIVTVDNRSGRVSSRTVGKAEIIVRAAETDNYNQTTVNISVEVKIDCTEHVWEGKYVISQPTCSAEGSAEYTCSVCGEKKIEKIPKIAHQYERRIVRASVAEDGEICDKCIVCGNEKCMPIYRVGDITIGESSIVYDGTEKKPIPVVKDIRGSLIPESNYALQYSGGRINAGTYKIKVTFKENYRGSKTLSYTIDKAENSISVSDIVCHEKDDEAQIETIVAQAHEDPQISYSSDNSMVKVDRAGKVTISAGFSGKAEICIRTAETANYQATAKEINVIVEPHDYCRYTIAAGYKKDGTEKYTCRKCLSQKENTIYAIEDIHLDNIEYDYDGQQHRPQVIMEDSTGKTISSEYYKVSYQADCASAGTHTVSIILKDKYSGVLTRKFTVRPIANEITAKNVEITASATKQQTFSINAKVNGNARLTYTSDNKAVTVDGSGKVSIAKNFVGKAKIKISALKTQNYNEATRTITVKVLPATTVISKLDITQKGKLKISWSKNTTGSGYQVQYSTDESFKTGVSQKNVSGKKKTSLEVTVKKGKKYYVRMRTYRVVGDDKYYSQWSKVKNVTVSK